MPHWLVEPTANNQGVEIFTNKQDMLGVGPFLLLSHPSRLTRDWRDPFGTRTGGILIALKLAGWIIMLFMTLMTSLRSIINAYAGHNYCFDLVVLVMLAYLVIKSNVAYITVVMAFS